MKTSTKNTTTTVALVVLSSLAGGAALLVSGSPLVALAVVGFALFGLTR